jgi:hypothetical protein
MTLAEIYEAYTPGSCGFVREVQKNLGLEISNEETERLGRACKTPEAFAYDLNHTAWWTDEAAASRSVGLEEGL